MTATPLCIPSFRARLDKFHFYGQWFYPGHVAECDGWLMGFGGVAYWASSLDKGLITALKDYPKGCFFHDDVWISG